MSPVDFQGRALKIEQCDQTNQRVSPLAARAVLAGYPASAEAATDRLEDLRYTLTCIMSP